MAFYIDDDENNQMDVMDFFSNRILRPHFSSAENNKDTSERESIGNMDSTEASVEAYPSPLTGVIRTQMVFKEEEEKKPPKDTQPTMAESIEKVKSMVANLKEQTMSIATSDQTNVGVLGYKDTISIMDKDPVNGILHTLNETYQNTDVLSERQCVSSLTKIMMTCQQILKERYGITE